MNLRKPLKGIDGRNARLFFLGCNTVADLIAVITVPDGEISYLSLVLIVLRSVWLLKKIIVKKER